MMAWVGAMNNIKNQVDEIINKEIIYKQHKIPQNCSEGLNYIYFVFLSRFETKRLNVAKENIIDI